MEIDNSVLVYDDDCGFCTWCAQWAVRRGGFEPVGFSALEPAQRERLPEEYERCAHLLTSSSVYSCGEAMEQALVACYPTLSILVWLCNLLPGWDRLREWTYRRVANNRGLFGRLVRKEPPIE